MSTWNPIAKPPRGIGDVLLRAGPGFMDGVYIGRQDGNRWIDQEGREAHPTHWAPIPAMDCDGVDG